MERIKCRKIIFNSFFSVVLASAMINWHWQAMLISYLSSKVVELPFNSIPELIENTNFKIAVLPGSYHEDAFKYANDPYWKIAWKERIQPFIHEYKGISDWIQVPKADPSTALYFTVQQARSF